MKRISVGALVAAVLLLGLTTHGEARHPGYRGQHGHYRGGVWIGVPFFWGAAWAYPAWRPYPYYSPPPLVIERQAPVYVQPEPQYWYYCQNPQGYHPYIQQCPGGWMQVVPPSAPPAP
jgi:hypothetical protein